MAIIILERLKDMTVARKTEMVESKGIGHPDTMADSIAESFSRNLSKEYLSKHHLILHHNVDKLDVVGGVTEPKFRGGRVIKPILVFFSGRATYLNEKMTDEDGHDWLARIAFQSAREWLGNHFRYLNPRNTSHLTLKPIFVQTKGGAKELKRTAEDRERVPESNDTSVGSGYFPLTPLESIVLGTRHHLNSAEFLRRHKHLGEDVKVMGVRKHDQIYLTVADSFVDKKVADANEYFAKKKELESELLSYVVGLCEKLEMRVPKVTLWINALDKKPVQSQKRPEDSCYLTVLGTSAEHGDDGAVGRGNRVNGVSPYYKPVSLEAASGKNPVSHVGKLYNVLAFLTAKRIFEEAGPGLREVYVKFVSKIGSPIDAPMLSTVLYAAKESLTAQEEREIQKMVRDELENHLGGGALRDEIIRGVYDHGPLLYLLE